MQVDGDMDGEAGRKGQTGRQKPTYAGGLVLEPKTGILYCLLVCGLWDEVMVSFGCPVVQEMYPVLSVGERFVG